MKTVTKREVTEVVSAARDLIKAHSTRSLTSENATLGEESALMFLKEKIDKLWRP